MDINTPSATSDPALRPTLWVYGVAVLAVLLAGWSWRAENTALLERLSVVAQEHRESLERRIASLHLTPRLLAEDPRLIEALRSPDRVPEANRLLARAQEQAGLAFVFLMAQNG